MSTSTPPRRRWLRFSLRTLLLFVLLIGSSATLWWNWGPWVPTHTIEEAFPVKNAFISDDCSSVLIHYADVAEPDNPVNCVDVRNATDGRSRGTLRAAQGKNAEVAVRGDYVLLSGDTSVWGQRPAKPTPAVFNMRTCQPLNSKFHLDQWADCALGDGVALINWSPGPLEFLGNTIYRKSRCYLVRLPTFETILNFGEDRDGSFTDDGRLVRHDSDQKGARVHVYDCQSGKEIATATAPTGGWGSSEALIGDHFCWSPDRILSIVNVRTGVRTTYSKDAFVTGVCKDGKRLWIAEGEMTTYRVEADHSTALYDFAAKLDHPIIRLPAASIVPSDDESVLISYDGRAYDGRSFQQLWYDELISVDTFDTHNKLLLCQYEGNRSRVLDARSGSTLMNFESWRLRPYGLNEAPLKLSKDAQFIVARTSNRVVLFRLRRPWQWYGPAYLPEFWLTIILAIALLWSILRDRKTLKPKTVKP